MTLLAWAAVLIAAATGFAPSAAPVPITEQGFGPVTIGMTRSAAQAALGSDWTYEAADEDCGYLNYAKGDDAFSPAYMIESDVVTMVLLYGTGTGIAHRTAEAVGLGDSADQVIAAYGDRLDIGTHAYIGEPAQYLTIWVSKDASGENGPRGIRFVTDENRRVVEIDAGGPAISYIEGCS